MIRQKRFLSRGFFVLTLLAGCSGSNQQKTSAEAGVDEPVRFKKHILTKEFISEGIAVGDLDRDGKIDVVAGTYWFKAPEWTRHEIAPSRAYDGSKEYCESFINVATDVNGDEWLDVIIVDFPGKLAHWYENPGNKPGHWKKHLLHESVLVGNESPAFVDMNGDGRIDLLCADSKEKQMVWLESPSFPTDTTWTKFTISEKNAPGTDRYSHGLGYGDINKDGRNDVFVKQGWWESPEDPAQPNWTFHPAPFGEDCSQMHVMDVNGDGLNDIISASAHRYGIWWYEQQNGPDGNSTWKQHEISKAFSQSHSSSLRDVNRDGHKDLISGKRFFAHNDTDHDPGTYEPAVLYWFEHQPGKEPFFIPHEIDNDSGSGLDIAAQDITNDGKLDIVISNKKGVFVFEQL